ADVQITWGFSHDMLTACLGRDRSTAFFPMRGNDRYRIVGVFPEGSDKKEGEVLYEEIERQILEDTQLKLDIYKVNWFSTYKVHSRRVNKFSEGRCFLAGDSAHIHSPAGAQGMNTGIQDGYNVAWKLAFVLRGDVHPKILDTYNEERIEIAKRLLQTTDRFFDLLVNPDWLLSFVRQHIFPHVANFVVGIDAVNQFFFPLISQIGIHYRHRTLSLDSGDDFTVQAGDRLPYFLINGASIYDRLHAPSFHLLTFTNEPADVSPDELKNKFGALLDCHTVPLNKEISEMFGASGPFNVLLRPDNHISMIFASTSAEPVTAFFTDVLGSTR
ncbi:MAG TPA: FAD-dependent monooxygenase, partial [Pyrinomonadaceae bacterium]|nr:FAD-dependent monooxygenase [Pyrinomonadaceae bacterium]